MLVDYSSGNSLDQSKTCHFLKGDGTFLSLDVNTIGSSVPEIRFYLNVLAGFALSQGLRRL